MFEGKLIEFGFLLRHGGILALDGGGFEGTLEGLLCPGILLDGKLNTTGDDVNVVWGRLISQLDLSNDLILAAEFRVVNEGSSLGTVGRKLAGGDIFKTLDNGGLAGAIVAYDQGEGSEELDGLIIYGTKTPDTGDLEFINA